MAAIPSDVELMRYVEGDLPSGRAARIRKLSLTDLTLAEAIERVRADVSLAPQLREVAVDEEARSAEKRIESALTDSVTRGKSDPSGNA